MRLHKEAEKETRLFDQPTCSSQVTFWFWTTLPPLVLRLLLRALQNWQLLGSWLPLLLWCSFSATVMRNRSWQRTHTTSESTVADKSILLTEGSIGTGAARTGFGNKTGPRNVVIKMLTLPWPPYIAWTSPRWISCREMFLSFMRSTAWRLTRTPLTLFFFGI